jgi:hypothetical protein
MKIPNNAPPPAHTLFWIFFGFGFGFYEEKKKKMKNLKKSGPEDSRKRKILL